MDDMRDKNRLISVVIPVFNGGKYLRETIESVLAQTYQPVEVIVVDDGSTDNSAVIARGFSPKVLYAYKNNGGISSALNRGVELSRGSFLAFLDADDLWEEDKLMHQMAVLDNDPAVDFVFGQVKQFFSAELDEDQKKKVRIPAEIMPGIFKGCMLVRRDSFLRVGMFETKWKLGDFIDWYSRAMEKGLKGIMLDELVMYRRIHADNTGIRQRKSRPEFVRILKASLDRRRKMQKDDGNI